MQHWNKLFYSFLTFNYFFPANHTIYSPTRQSFPCWRRDA